MRKFYGRVIKHRYIIMILFLVAAAIGAICRPLVKVNYDMNDYLPATSKSTVSLGVMNSEFDTAIPNARVMVKASDRQEAIDIKEKLEKVDGVSAVTWLDDLISVDMPFDIYPKATLEKYYKNGYALFTITIEEDKRQSAVNEMYKIVGDDGALTGSAVSTAVATTSTLKEVKKISVIAVLFVLLILMLTTTSWIEPFVVLIGIGISVIINAGSNLIFGEISFVTNAAGNVLQLAVSLDYSVFLIHRFSECREKFEDPKEAMVEALTRSTSSILSSGLTTVIGFLALLLMRFQIGSDLGMALAKGIFISLLSVFLFMPGVILRTYPWMEKTSHRSFLPSFRGFGRFIRRVMLPLSLVFVIISIPAYITSNSNSYYYGSSHIFGSETRLGSDTDKISKIFGKSDNYVLMVPKGNDSKEKQLVEEIENLDNVKSVTAVRSMIGNSIPSAMLPSRFLSKLQSDNYGRMVINVGVGYEGTETFNLVKTIRKTAQKYYPDKYYLAGEGVSTYDLKTTVNADMLKVNGIAILAVFIVLLLSMKSVLLPVILVLTIETAIWINLSIPHLTRSSIFYIAYLIISSIQLGATVDYAILLTERYKENRLHLNRKEAIVETISNVTASILTSGTVLTIVGFLLGFISSHGVLSQLGFFLGHGSLCSMLAVLFILPGFLYITDQFTIRQSQKKVSSQQDKL